MIVKIVKSFDAINELIQDVGFGVESIEGLKTGVKEATIQLEEMKNQLTSSVNLLSKQSGEVVRT